MILPYTKCKGTRGSQVSYRPVIDVILKHGSKSFSTKALLDTGADITLINKQMGKALGVDFPKCERGSVTGIGGKSIETWTAEIEIEVENLAESRHLVKVDFVDSPTVGVLLGHRGFFENYSVKFDTYQVTFEITNPSV